MASHPLKYLFRCIHADGREVCQDVSAVYDGISPDDIYTKNVELLGPPPSSVEEFAKQCEGDDPSEIQKKYSDLIESYSHPKKSQFFDVDVRSVEEFHIGNHERSFALDLLSLRFSGSDGMLVFYDEQGNSLEVGDYDGAVSDVELHYFRRYKIDVNGITGKKISCQYHFGWTGNDNGRVVKRMAVIV
jgi:hypothetical protein